MQEDTVLFWSYVISCCCAVTSLVCFPLSWSHWAYTLDTCPGHDCECILFGKSFDAHFSGGKTIYCYFITFLQVPLFLTAAILSFYQARLVLLVKREYKRSRNDGKSERNPFVVRVRNGHTLKEGDVVMEEKKFETEPPPRRTNIVLLVMSCICFLLFLSVLIMHVIGYYSTCNEYRKTAVKLLGASGRMAGMLKDRVSCETVFDFMDYLQPRKMQNSRAYYGQGPVIDTWMSLFMSQTALLTNTIVWLVIISQHVKLMKKRKEYNKKWGEDVEIDSRRRK